MTSLLSVYSIRIAIFSNLNWLLAIPSVAASEVCYGETGSRIDLTLTFDKYSLLTVLGCMLSTAAIAGHCCLLSGRVLRVRDGVNRVRRLLLMQMFRAFLGCLRRLVQVIGFLKRSAKRCRCTRTSRMLQTSRSRSMWSSVSAKSHCSESFWTNKQRPMFVVLYM